MIESLCLLYLVGHLGHTTKEELPDTSGLVSTDKTPWANMYRRDKYARDRVMKSARLLLPYLSQDDKNPSTILDVGCFTWEARKYFPRSVKYIGIDQEKYHSQTQVMNLHHGFQPIPCNLALCLETLEHLLDPEDTLQSIYDSLPENGYLVVSLPNETTIFHRLRTLMGICDAECFSGEGKHLHLPSLKQCREFLGKKFLIHSEYNYISPTACNSSHSFLGSFLRLIPDTIHLWFADRFPSLFARGFIFLLKKK